MSDADSAGATYDGASEQPDDAHEQIGPFRLLQRIGEGGFGVVYLAEQTEPVRRRVALKVIKPGMDTKAVIARFHAERQAIALMDHPGIARALDAGATEAGRPYFAMEFVQGEPITDFCDRHRLTIRQRLELFRRVCSAVQHAHSKGVIHRDLKPSNILVAYRDGKASPKVIDFGVAKALNQRLTDGTIFTHQGQLIGTPEYMSPEQAEMTALDVDTRSDIYSLGVVLYELLTGELPFSSETLRGAGPAEIQRLIREQDPPRPSTRLSTIAHHAKDPATATRIARARQVQARELPSQLRGDLDWIVMRCLEKDRERRYETANAVALEIDRYLRNEPVNAGPPGASYRVRKFVRRNRLTVTAAGLVGAAVVLGLVGTGVGLVRAREARQVAEAARADAELRAAELEAVIDLQSEMLTRIEPAAMGATLFERLRADVRAASPDDPDAVAGLEAALEALNATDVALDVLNAEILTPALEAADERLGDRPLIRAEILTSLGGMLRSYGLLEQADSVLRRALEIRREQLGEDDLTTARSLIALGKLSRQRGRYEEAQAMYARALEIRERELGPDDEYTLSAVYLTAALEEDFQRSAEAEALYQRALEGRRALFGEESEEVLDVLSSLAGLYRDLGRLAEAEPIHLRVLETRRRLLGEDHEDTRSAMTNLATVYWDQRRFDEAADLMTSVLEGDRRTLGSRHPGTLLSMTNLAVLLHNREQYDEAIALAEEALEGRRRVFGAEHPAVLTSMNNLAVFYEDAGRPDEAERLFKRTLDAKRRVLGDDHPDTFTTLRALGAYYRRFERYADAEPYLVEAVERSRAALGPNHPDTVASLNGLAVLRALQGRDREALDLRTEEYAARRVMLGDDDSRTLDAGLAMVTLNLDLGRLDDAAALYGDIIRRRAESRGDADPTVVAWRRDLGAILFDAGRVEQARPILGAALEGEAAIASAPDATPGDKNNAAWELLTCVDESLRDPARALVFAKDACEGTNFEDFAHLDTYALALHETGDTAQAVEMSRRAVALLPDGMPEDDAIRQAVLEALATYEAAIAAADEGGPTEAGS